ncbi:MAG: hypothetical protein ACK2T6_05900 [Anaerolineae bacterium]
MPEQHVVLRHREIDRLRSIDVYVGAGGYEQLRRAVTGLRPSAVIDLV